MKYTKNIIVFLFLFLHLYAGSQDFYWVAFTDKNNSEFSLSKPEEYLSPRAIQRRVKQEIKIDSLDLPVNRQYIEQVVDLGATLVHISKWLNGITVQASAEDFAEKVLQLSFVKEVQRTKTANTKSAVNKFREPANGNPEPVNAAYYGPSVFQTAIMNGQYLHNRDFKGQGMQIAVLDGGFFNADVYPALKDLWDDNRMLGTRDFVDPAAEFFATHYHGMSVLSCMGGFIEGELVGTAPEASYWLIRSEDTDSEFLIEEDNWVAAAEFADSAGVDIINSSLGYYEFDDPTMNHHYSDMDGNTTRVTRGANIAASRGMLVFASAGNEGNSPWKYLIAPSDGDSVFAVGAVNKDTIPAKFTSYGPAFDGDVKPNGSAVGWNTYLQKSTGTLGFSNGTSFSSPVLAGMAACLWQSVPQAKAFEVKQAIEQSSHLYQHPDSLLGYGVPDFKKAYEILDAMVKQRETPGRKWLVYPNPANKYVNLQKIGGNETEPVEIDVYSVSGALLKKWIKSNSSPIILNEIGTLPAGILILKIQSGDETEVIKLDKIR